MKAGTETMTVGIAARRAGVKIDTIRYYERRALLPKSPRTEAGYRTLTDETVQRVRFIKHAQALGFALNEIKQLLALRLTPGKTCADVRSRAEAKTADIERKIRSLQVMKRALQQLVSACKSDGPASKCSFLENLNKEDMI
jgi:MerR family transcriptional regulator, copper efflux regulator